MKTIRLYFLALFCLTLVGCSSVGTSIEKFRGQSAQRIYDDGVHDMLHHNYRGASDRFEALDALYPFSQYIQQAQLNVIYAYYKQRNVASVLAACDRYLRLYPGSQHLDYVYYMRGITEMNKHRGLLEHFFPSDPATRDLSGFKSAYMDFDTLLKLYPRSPYTPDAVRRMAFIRNTMARHSLEVGQYYYDRRSYIAAANRAKEIIERYQQTPAIPKALVLMIKSYRQLGLDKQAAQALKVLEYNYKIPASQRKELGA